MKILIITGSPHRGGTSEYLADCLRCGAQDAGHAVTVFDAGHREIHPCTGCEACHRTAEGEPCIYQDDMREFRVLFTAADAVVFCSPIYCYSVTAQMKIVQDRLYEFDRYVRGGKKMAVILTMGSPYPHGALGAQAGLENYAAFLQYETVGMLVAAGCGSVEQLLKTDYPRQAYQLGRNAFGSAAEA